jgi:hypothetical protein
MFVRLLLVQTELHSFGCFAVVAVLHVCKGVAVCIKAFHGLPGQ